MCFELSAVSVKVAPAQSLASSGTPAQRTRHYYLYPLSSLNRSHIVLCDEYTTTCHASCDATRSGLDSLTPGAKLAALEYLDNSPFARSNPKLRDALRPAIMRAKRAIELLEAMHYGSEFAQMVIERRREQVSAFLDRQEDRKDLEPLKGWAVVLAPVERWFTADANEVKVLQEIGESFEISIDEVLID